MNTLPRTGFVRLPQVLEHIPVARSTWWAGVKDGRFPTSVKIGGVTAWRVGDIQDLIDMLGGKTPENGVDAESISLDSSRDCGVADD